MDKETAKVMIAQIEHQISVINHTIASYKQQKQRLIGIEHNQNTKKSAIEEYTGRY